MHVDTVPRLSPQYVRKKLLAGDDDLLLVCIYSQEKYDSSHLEGAISMPDFRSRLDSLPKSTEIAFY
jgi:hypothetical protein